MEVKVGKCAAPRNWWWCRPGVLMTVLLVGVGSAAHAFGGSFGLGFASHGRAPLSVPRDPLEFAAGLDPLVPISPVPLTVEDAVAQELLLRSPTLGAVDAARTAQVLCREARLVGYDPLLFLAVIHVESYYNHLAISPVGAEGLMQLMPETAQWMAGRLGIAWPESHSFDPELNVQLGVRYLVHLHRQFRGRLDNALTAYNRGPRATRYILGREGRLPPEIRDFYATKVLDRYRRLRATYAKLPLV